MSILKNTTGTPASDGLGARSCIEISESEARYVLEWFAHSWRWSHTEDVLAIRLRAFVERVESDRLKEERKRVATRDPGA